MTTFNRNKTDNLQAITKNIREYILIRVDGLVFTHVLLWRSPLQDSLIVRFGTVINGSFFEQCAEYFDGEDVPDIHDGSAWDLKALYCWLQYSEIADMKPQSVHACPDGLTDIQRQIYIAVLENGRMSRCQIAKVVRRSKSSWLNVHIEGLVEQGYLTRKAVQRPNGFAMFLYTIKA